VGGGQSVEVSYGGGGVNYLSYKEIDYKGEACQGKVLKERVVIRRGMQGEDASVFRIEERAKRPQRGYI